MGAIEAFPMCGTRGVALDRDKGSAVSSLILSHLRGSHLLKCQTLVPFAYFSLVLLVSVLGVDIFFGCAMGMSLIRR